MEVRKNSVICFLAMYSTIALTFPYEWRIGVCAIILSSSCAMIVVIPLYILCKIRSRLMLVYIIYNGILLFSTYLNSIPMSEQIKLSLIGISLSGAFELINKYATKRQFLIYVLYFTFLVIVNSMQTIYYGGTKDAGRYLCIFGHKNWYLYKTLPAFYLILLWFARYRKQIQSIWLSIVWGMALISVMIAGSSAGTLVLSLWGLYVIFIPLIKRIKQDKIFDNYVVYMSMIVLIFFIIVVWNAAEIFSPIIVDLLGKELTFTTRTRIWGRALELIREKPIMGYGALEEKNFISLFYDVPEFSTTHNQYLGELFRGGILLLTAFVTLMVSVFRKLWIAENADVSKAMTFGLFCMLLWWMMEGITSMYLILVLFVSYHLPECEEG